MFLTTLVRQHLACRSIININSGALTKISTITQQAICVRGSQWTCTSATHSFCALGVSPRHYCTDGSGAGSENTSGSRPGREVTVDASEDGQQHPVTTGDDRIETAPSGPPSGPRVNTIALRRRSNAPRIKVSLEHELPTLDRNRSVLLADTTEQIDPKAAANDNDEFHTEFVNRNPRNLEMMRLDVKDLGWETERTKRNYYNKVVLERSKNHITVKLVHISGKTILSASTREFCIARHLYSTRGNSALINMGRVLARRCLQVGIRSVHFDPILLEESHPLTVLRSAMQGAGVEGQELPHLRSPLPLYQRQGWASPYSAAPPDRKSQPPPGLVPTDAELLAQKWEDAHRRGKSAEQIIMEVTDTSGAEAATTASGGKKKK